MPALHHGQQAYSFWTHNYNLGENGMSIMDKADSQDETPKSLPKELDDKLCEILLDPETIHIYDVDTPNITKKIAQIHQAYNECGYLYFTEIPAKPLMTGEEWYKRFEQELPSVLNMLSDESAVAVSLEAAKRASNLTEGDASLSQN